MKPAMTFYGAFTACSRVTMTALEQVGAEYDLRMINFMAGEHRSPEFLAINPQGKVPALVVSGRGVLTENAAILSWLHATCPDAGLLPVAAGAWDEARHLAALLWVASGWHPAVRSIKVPFLLTEGDPAPVRARGEENFAALLDQLDRHLAREAFWFGDSWSIVDTYLWWAYTNSEFGGFVLDKWDNIARHRKACEAIPAQQRALAREAAAHASRQDKG